jgi:hypothetical protein
VSVAASASSAAAPAAASTAAGAPPSLIARAQAAAGLAHLSPAEALVFVWFALDAWTHFVIEGLYLFFALQTGGAEKSLNPLAFVWREYGKADSRWMTYADPDVMAVELPTVLLMGPGALLCAYATFARKDWKHIAIILVSWCEIIVSRPLALTPPRCLLCACACACAWRRGPRRPCFHRPATLLARRRGGGPSSAHHPCPFLPATPAKSHRASGRLVHIRRPVGQSLPPISAMVEEPACG